MFIKKFTDEQLFEIRMQMDTEAYRKLLLTEINHELFGWVSYEDQHQTYCSSTPNTNGKYYAKITKHTKLKPGHFQYSIVIDGIYIPLFEKEIGQIINNERVIFTRTIINPEATDVL